MKKKQLRRKQAELLIEHILNKDPISANSIFQKLIMEAEEDRENDVATELGLDDDTNSDDDADVEDENGQDMFDDQSGDSIDQLGSEETDTKVDDIIEINCQINAKLISNLFDKIAELKNQVEGLNLDPTSREYLKYDVSIQYYSDKLQDLQNKTNPGIDQSKVEEALNKITTAIEELSGELGGSSVDGEDDITDINSPEEINAENDLSDEDEGNDEESNSEETEETSDEDLEEEPESSSEDEAEAEDKSEKEETDINDIFS